MVREFVLGKGRGQPDTSQNEGQREQSNEDVSVEATNDAESYV